MNSFIHHVHGGLSRQVCRIVMVRRVALGLLLLLIASAPDLRAAELVDVKKDFLAGQYESVVKECQRAIKASAYEEEWRVLLCQSLLILGRYPEAKEELVKALDRFSSSLRIRLVGHDVHLQNGDTNSARQMLTEIDRLASSRNFSYRNAGDLVTLGQAALLMGVDPKLVLDRVFDQAKRADPDNREIYIASGEIALDKHDYPNASKFLLEGEKKLPKDPDIQFALARTFASGDRKQATLHLEAALSLNTNHIQAHLFLADHHIDAEDYDGAESELKQVLRVNPWQSDAWAYRAVLSHLKSDTADETNARETALKFWPTNPRVDHLIGKKLSEKYRFTEGAAHQRTALEFDPGYSSARIQLAQDLLRLGEDAEGWQLAEQANKEDPYDKTIFNLVTLKDSLAKFTTLSNGNFIVRMGFTDAGVNEAQVYGDKVMALLERARATLTEKYGMKLEQPTIVEIFPKQKDFGVRTFGMPHNPGFLGVCFGRVITANSPSSQGGSPSNWEAVLWHEFCHVVTLQMTKNKMPRWLSEGISVHEELQANPTWGQSINPRYREMILGDDLTPVSELSGAFLTPKTPMHIQFAYYESALVVEFLVKNYGMEALRQILRDLGAGTDINAAIAKRTAPMEKIEKEFAAFARKRAESLAPGLNWEAPDPEDPPRTDADWAKFHPKNFYRLSRDAKKLVAARKWKEAEVPLKELLSLYPTHAESLNLLATVQRGLKADAAERETLRLLASTCDSDIDAYLRLMDLAAAEKNWTEVAQNSERFLAVNPLVPQPYRYRAIASEALGQNDNAIDATRTLLKLDPPDPADAHYRLARLLGAKNDPAAKRELLLALEEAPRFRDAHKLLLEMAKKAEASGEAPASKGVESPK